jgi:ABC-type sugar transport system ATPase subunit
MEGISKEFPGVQALDKVDFEAYLGEVTALVGENGAGKSTLMKILSGAYKKDSGRIYLDGKRIELENPYHAQKLGISTIYQEFNLRPNQTVAANIFCNRESRKNGILGNLGFIDKEKMEREAKKLLDIIGADISPSQLVRNLSVAERQMVEIAKALSFKAKIIIMDEPTSALGPEEVEKLFKIIQQLKEQGITVIFISHRLEEVFRIADRITVLRDGKLVGTMTRDSATFISSHPGATMKDAWDLAIYVKGLGHYLEHIQDYTPLPLTPASCAFYTEYHPDRKEKIYVAKTYEEGKLQRALVQYRDRKNREFLLKNKEKIHFSFNKLFGS